MRKRPTTAGVSRKKLCPLSDPSVGIVSENDHKVGLCLCRFCDCGEHTCPVLDKNEIYLRSAFQSSYMKAYQNNSFDSPLKMQQKLFRPNTNKMDFQTTNQTEYKPFRIVPKTPTEKPIDTNNALFRGSSQYANDFPDWGENNISHEKRWYPPLRSTEIPFSGRSTYKESFNKCSQSLNHIKGDMLAASKSTISFAPKDKFDGVTTYMKSIGNYSGTVVNKKIVVVGQPIQEMKVTKNHFKTTNKCYFKDGAIPADPRLFKQKLISRSISANKAVKKKV